MTDIPLQPIDERMGELKLVDQNSKLLALPPELLLEISRWAITGGKIAAMTPFNIGCICRGWRDLVFRCGELWQSIDITLYPSGSWRQLTLLKEWVERTRGHAFSLSMTAPRNLPRGIAVYQRIIQLLPNRSTQISSLKVVMPRDFLTPSKNPKPRIILGLSSQKSPPTRILARLARGMLHFGADTSPLITTATLGKFYARRISLPWTALLHFHIHDCLHHQMPELLSLASNLHAHWIVYFPPSGHRLDTDYP
ncbi:hypothetical protein DFP72DRAFT_461711 [Ephemerocybe angulata]|uniref:F-box domain-containing protein n=1 Tax=Ephemerocybe angulata TaxID=980116 RepID=A0A8H6HTE9_9AGAR|nr:hypothetical protein DFP72DRAFT_461711 [Tulosesus angulatus]